MGDVIVCLGELMLPKGLFTHMAKWESKREEEHSYLLSN